MTAFLSGTPAGLVLGLVRPYAGVILACAVLGALGGLSVAGLLAVINRGLHGPAADGSGLLAAFVGLCLLTLIGSIGSDVGANVIGQRVVATLRKALADWILTAPIDALERYRLHRLIPVLTRDVDTISDVAFSLSTLAVALTVTAGCPAISPCCPQPCSGSSCWRSPSASALRPTRRCGRGGLRGGPGRRGPAPGAVPRHHRGR